MSFCYNSAKTELVALRSQNLKMGSKDYAMEKSLASHQRGPGSRKKTKTHVIRDLLTSIFPRSEPTACFLGLVGRLGPLLSLAKGNLIVFGLTIYTQSLIKAVPSFDTI